MNASFSIITTVDMSYRKIDLIKKTIIFIKNSKSLGCPIVLAYRRRSVVDDMIMKLIIWISSASITLVKVKYNHQKINNSILRNSALQATKTKYVIFSDIDLFFDQKIIEHMLEEAEKQNFSMIPVLYLSKYGTKTFLRHKNFMKIIHQWLNFDFTVFLHIAICSSFMCVKRDDVKKIYGFDEQYYGHGYEDFDFMLRIINLYHPQLITPEQASIDEPYISPLLAKGFRAEIGTFTIENILRKNIAFHLFHKKNKTYYTEDRKRNKMIFLKKFSVQQNEAPYSFIHSIPRLIPVFYSLCQKLNMSAHEYAILFNTCPRWKVRGH